MRRKAESSAPAGGTPIPVAFQSTRRHPGCRAYGPLATPQRKPPGGRIARKGGIVHRFAASNSARDSSLIIFTCSTIPTGWASRRTRRASVRSERAVARLSIHPGPNWNAHSPASLTVHVYDHHRGDHRAGGTAARWLSALRRPASARASGRPPRRPHGNVCPAHPGRSPLHLPRSMAPHLCDNAVPAHRGPRRQPRRVRHHRHALLDGAQHGAHAPLPPRTGCARRNATAVAPRPLPAAKTTRRHSMTRRRRTTTLLYATTVAPPIRRTVRRRLPGRRRGD